MRGSASNCLTNFIILLLLGPAPPPPPPTLCNPLDQHLYTETVDCIRWNTAATIGLTD